MAVRRPEVAETGGSISLHRHRDDALFRISYRSPLPSRIQLSLFTYLYLLAMTVEMN